jgi:hypothetical protein
MWGTPHPSIQNRLRAADPRRDVLGTAAQCVPRIDHPFSRAWPIGAGMAYEIIPRHVDGVSAGWSLEKLGLAEGRKIVVLPHLIDQYQKLLVLLEGQGAEITGEV